MCWINSDDVLWEGALHYVSNLFSSNPAIQWLQGYPSVIDEQGNVILQRARRVFSKFFFYLKKHENDFSFIQQESTFWSRRLWERAGAKMDLSYSIAADFDLWMRFFKFEILYCTNKQLGAFRKRANQQSANTLLYLEEANRSIEKNKPFLSVNDKVKLSLAFFLHRSRFLPVRFSKKMISLIIGKPQYV